MINDKTKNFIEKSINVHGNKYDYSKVKYINSDTKVIIICPEHGEFLQTPNDHLAGHKCMLCSKKHGITENNWHEMAINIHDNTYNYDKVIYKNVTDKVIITCPKHGDFEMPLYSHIIHKQKCPKCQGKKLTTKEWIERFREVHGDKYDYSKVVYKSNREKVIIICPEHGEFLQTPSKHYNKKQGCPKCGKINGGIKQCLTTETFIIKAKKCHNDSYDYSKTNYITAKTPITITCPKHGDFTQMPNDHLDGHGCKKCSNNNSKNENDIYTILENKLGNNAIIKHNRTIIGNHYEIDMYIPDLKLGIEYNGLLWHSEIYGKMKNYHLYKTEKCEEQGVRLIQIFEDEYINNKNLVLNKLFHILKINDSKEKIMARKCIIKEINHSDASLFLNKYHIQGSCKMTISLGAYYNDELIGVMTFTKTNKINEWELSRFASNYNYICSGLGGKLFKYFIKTYNPLIVKSFADRRWTDIKNNIYIKLGFINDKILNPDYHYISYNYPNERIHKFNFRKKKLLKKYPDLLNENMTENEMTKLLGYFKIWDCGLIRYIWKRED